MSSAGRTIPPSDLIPAPDRNELTSLQAALQAGAQMFLGAEDVTIHGGEFNAVDQRTFTFNVFPPTASSGYLTRPEGRHATGATSVSRIGRHIQSPNNQVAHSEEARSEEHISPLTGLPVEILQWDHPNVPTPNFREPVASIFHRGLLRSGHGLPVWNPMPSRLLPMSYRRKGISIGDLGLMTIHGSFKYLFNITLPVNHPNQPINLPQGLLSPSSPAFDEEILAVPYRAPFKSFTSNHISITYPEDRSGVSFRCSSSATEGAIITLPLGCTSYDTSNEASFRQHFLENALRWYAYEIDLMGSRARNGDLGLVIGCDRCEACGLAAFGRDPSRDVDLSYGMGREVDGIQTYMWRHVHGASFQDHRSFSEVADILELRGDDVSEQGCYYENLCIFVRTLNARLRDDLWAELQRASDSRRPCPDTPEGAGGPAHTPDKSAHVDVFDSESIEPAPSSPSNTINEYLLKMNGDAKMAITSDNQWISVLKEDDSQFPHPEELIKRVLERYEVEFGGGVAFLKPKIPYPSPNLLGQNPLSHSVDPRQEASKLADSAAAANERGSRQLHLPKLSTVLSLETYSGNHSPDSDAEPEECTTPCGPEVGLFRSPGGKVLDAGI